MTTFPPWGKSEDTNKISNIACHSGERQFSTPLTWDSICFLVEKNTQGPAPEENLFYPQLTDFWLAQFWDNALERAEKFAEWKKARGLMTTIPSLCKVKIKRGLMSALFEQEIGELWKQITWFLQLWQRHKILLLLSNRQMPLFPVIAQAGKIQFPVSLTSHSLLPTYPQNRNLKWCPGPSLMLSHT